MNLLGFMPDLLFDVTGHIRMEAPSPTGAMAAIYDKEMPSIEEYVKHFRLIDSQVGAIFMINGKVVGQDAFGNPGTFSDVFKKLLESYTLDAIDWYDPDNEHKALKSEVTRFQKSALSATASAGIRPSVGLGTDFRLESRKVTGFALALDDQLLHVSIFARADGGDRDVADSRIERFSRRRRNRKG